MTTKHAVREKIRAIEPFYLFFPLVSPIPVRIGSTMKISHKARAIHHKKKTGKSAIYINILSMVLYLL